MKDSLAPQNRRRSGDGAFISRLRHAIRAAHIALRRLRRRPYSGIHHDDVMAHLSDEGRISVRYSVLTALSCGIAILGLLQSSPAVVIGAMLISPLMGPILLSGFSLAELDHRLALKGLRATAFATVLTIALTAIIVWMSPLTSVTSEILARTRPNFFDLLVAVLSGIAGAYAVAHRKGETIVGVAIATALMPPLAVIGYGLAVGNWAIFAGACGLYMTNLLAIGLTASLVARFFGFGSEHPHHHRTLHTMGIIAAFAFLSIPLGLSLRQIAHEAILTAKARTTLQNFFTPHGDHLYGMEIRFPDDKPIQIDALVLSERTRIGVETNIRTLLQRELGKPVTLSLSQVPIRAHESLDRQAVAEMIGKSAAAMHRQLQPHPDITLEIAAQTQEPTLAISVDKAAKTALIRVASCDAARLMVLRTAQQTLTQRFAGWHFGFRFSAAMPPLNFAAQSTRLNENARQTLDMIVWALHENGARKLHVRGYSDTTGHHAADREMARKRALTVAKALQSFGFETITEARYPAGNQRQTEGEQGHAAFRRVEITAVPAG